MDSILIRIYTTERSAVVLKTFLLRVRFISRKSHEFFVILIAKNITPFRNGNESLIRPITLLLLPLLFPCAVIYVPCVS